MTNKRNIASVIFKGVVTVCALIGILFTAVGSPNVIMTLSYYTLMSNIAVFLMFAVLLAWELTGAKRTKGWFVVKMTFTVGIFLTFVIFHFVLRPTMFEMGGGAYLMSVGNIFVHYVTPLLAVADYFIFDVKGKIRWWHPLVWTAEPYGYLLYSTLYAAFGGVFGVAVGEQPASKVPYFFLDTAQFGGWGVFLNIVLITIGYIAVAYLFFLLDWAIKRRKNTPNDSTP